MVEVAATVTSIATKTRNHIKDAQFNYHMQCNHALKERGGAQMLLPEYSQPEVQQR